METKMKTRLTLIFRVLLSLILIVFLLYKADMAELLQALKNVNGVLITSAFILIIIGVVGSSFKWKVILAAYGHKESVWQLSILYFIGLFFNAFLPTTIGGDIYRISALGKKIASTRHAIITVFLDRAFGFYAIIMLLFLSALALLKAPEFVYQFKMIMIIAAMIGIVVPLFAVFAILHRSEDNQKDHLRSGILAKIMDGLLMVASITKNVNATLLAIGVSVIFQIFSVLSSYLAARSIGIELDLLSFFFVVPVVTMMAMMPVSINGIGVRESAYVILLTQIGVSTEKALLLSLLIYSMVLIASVIGGIMFAITKKANIVPS